MPLTFDILSDRIPIVAENIIDEAATHPGKFVDAGRYRVQCMRNKNVAKAKLEGRRTLLAIRFRKKAYLRGDKLTDTAVKEKVENSPSIRMLKQRYDRADEAEVAALCMYSAYFARQQSLRIIADQQNLEGVRGSREVDRAEESRKLRKRASDAYEQRHRRRHGVAQEEPES